MLFNVYIEDLVKSLQSCQTDPVHLQGTPIECLLYADDLLLLSNSANGLQNAVNGINEYSAKWGLRINTDKTKVMIFQTLGRLRKRNVLLNGKALEIVSEGIQLSWYNLFIHWVP